MSNGDPGTRDKILAATRLLMEKGSGRGVRMSDIASEAGVSRQAIYLHFGSRAGLLLATVQFVDKQERFQERAVRVCNMAQADRALRAFIEFWADYSPRIYGMAKALMTMKHKDQAAAAAWENRMSGLRGICALLASRLKDQDRLAQGWSVDRTADFLWSMISIPMWENLVLERGWSSSEYADAVYEGLRGVILQEPSNQNAS